jgi:hypothetical protein
MSSFLLAQAEVIPHFHEQPEVVTLLPADYCTPGAAPGKSRLSILGARKVPELLEERFLNRF